MSQGTEFLTLINEKLKHKIQEVNHALLEGQKEIESMHTYYLYRDGPVWIRKF